MPLTRSPRFVALAGALSITLLAGCSSSGDAPAKAAPTAAKASPAAAVATASPSPSASGLTGPQGTPTIEAPKVDPSALKKYGADLTDSAWKFSTDLAKQWTFRPELVAKEHKDMRVQDYEGLLALMKPKAAKDVAATINQARKDPDKSYINTFALSAIDDDGEGWQLDPAGPVSNWEITGAVTTDTDGLMWVTMRQAPTVHMVDRAGERSTYTLERTMHLWLEKQDDSSWLIDRSRTDWAPQKQS